MGTSLKVHGIKQLVRDFAKVTRASTPAATKATSESSTGVKRPPPRIIFVNRTPPPAEWTNIFDVWVQGDTDDFVERVETGWRKARPADWETQTTLDATVVKNEPKPKVQRPTVSNMRPKEAQKPKGWLAWFEHVTHLP
jgi:NAD+-dependent protein deacetylase SIR2